MILISLTTINKETCVSLTRREKTKYYANLNVKYVAENSKFWRPIKPCFSDKFETSDKVVLIENEKMVTKDDNVPFTFTLRKSIEVCWRKLNSF